MPPGADRHQRSRHHSETRLWPGRLAALVRDNQPDNSSKDAANADSVHARWHTPSCGHRCEAGGGVRFTVLRRAVRLPAGRRPVDQQCAPDGESPFCGSRPDRSEGAPGATGIAIGNFVMRPVSPVGIWRDRSVLRAWPLRARGRAKLGARLVTPTGAFRAVTPAAPAAATMAGPLAPLVDPSFSWADVHTPHLNARSRSSRMARAARYRAVTSLQPAGSRAASGSPPAERSRKPDVSSYGTSGMPAP